MQISTIINEYIKPNDSTSSSSFIFSPALIIKNKIKLEACVIIIIIHNIVIHMHPLASRHLPDKVNIILRRFLLQI